MKTQTNQLKSFLGTRAGPPLGLAPAGGEGVGVLMSFSILSLHAYSAVLIPLVSDVPALKHSVRAEEDGMGKFLTDSVVGCV